MAKGMAFSCKFFILYALIFMAGATYNTFIPVYLNSLGFSKTNIGTLLSVGPFIALIAQPVWGTICDKAKYKNNILMMLIIGSAVSIVFFYFSHSYIYILLIMIVFTFFSIAISPLSDTITLEYLDTKKLQFGPVRMMGTIGFAVMSFGAGILADKNISLIFITYFIFMALALMVASQIPKIGGHSSKNNDGVSILSIFKNIKFMIFLFYNLIMSIICNFYGIFFPIYYNQIGASNSLLGLAGFIEAASEIPFLLFADKIIKKIGMRNALIISTSVAAFRCLVLYFIENPYIVLPFQVLNGFMYVVYAYSLAIFVNNEMPKELKAFGQTMNAFVFCGLARIVSGIFGGILSDKFSIRIVFLLNFIIAASFTILFIAINIFYLKKHMTITDIEKRV